MKALTACVCIVLLAASAKAEDPAPLVLEVRAARVERGELERALRDELESDRAAGEPASGRLELSEGAGDVVRLSYRDASGKLATRDLRVARDDPEALEKITLAAANLVRDQSAIPSELAALAAQQAAADQEPPEVPPPARPEDLEPAPSACTVQAPVLVFGADLVPGVGTSSSRYARGALRRFSLNLLGTYNGGVRGFEASVGFNIGRHGVCGFQGAAGFNLSRGPVHGVQLALANLALGPVRGAQIGLANFTRARASAQFAIANVAIGGASAQLGVGNLARLGAGVQLGVGNIALGDSAAQIGVGNLGWGDVRGAQLGVVNIARDEVPLQLGVVNVSTRARAPIGVVSIVRDGRTTFDSWISENGTILGGVTHGGDVVHNIYAAGARVGDLGTRLVYALGIGARVFDGALLKLEIDGIYEHVAQVDYFRSRTSVARVRLNAAIALYERLSLLVAAGYAVMDTDEAGEGTQAAFGEHVLARAKADENHVVYGFPSLSIGLRVALSDRR